MNIYTMEQWQADGTFNAAPGQGIEDAVYNEMLNCVPPKSLPSETAQRALNKYGIRTADSVLYEPRFY